MPELRWTLLIIGVVFIAALAWWERRKPHQASRDSPEMRPGSSDVSWGPEPDLPPRTLREPTLTLPEIRARDVPATRELPVVEIPGDDPMLGLHANDPVVELGQEEMLSDPITRRAIVQADIAEDESMDDAAEEAEEEAQEDAAEDDADADADADEAEFRLPGPVVHDTPDDGVPEVDESVGESVSDVRIVPPPELPAPAAPAGEPMVEWPPEEQRKLIALRLVSSHPERLQGRAVRQALAAEGFVLGKYGIFHKPDAQNRAVLSAASLTKPGTFDPETMDSQRFVGLNIFAVLPGPKPPHKAFDELLLTARTLNERLEGALQDERGGPLTPMRIAALREALETEAGS